jgi:hypothetical protein
MAASNVIELRNLLAERFPQSFTHRHARLITGVRPLDQATGGGLAKGAITELISPQPSAGSALLIAALLQTARRDRYFVALIDGRDSFDPTTAAGSANNRLPNLLWVRCRRSLEAVKAADLLLRDGNFSLVILDLVLNTTDELRKIRQTNWYRLQRLVEPAATAFLVITRQAMISSAQRKLVLENQWQLADIERGCSAAGLAIRVEGAHGGLSQLTESG